MSEKDESKEAGYALYDAMRASLSAMDSTTSWRSSRADQQRYSGHNLDYALLRFRKVRRLTARLPVGLEIDGRKGSHDTVQDYLRENRHDLNTQIALRHSERRAKYRVGRGLLDAACAMVDRDLLSEARVFNGLGQKRPQRLLVRDAVFAAEDQSLEDMIDILIDAPDDVAEIYDQSAPRRHRSKIEAGVTPLIYVHCSGISDDLRGHREVVLEAVDFGSIDTLHACQQAMRRRSEDMFRKGQDAMIAMIDR